MTTLEQLSSPKLKIAAAAKQLGVSKQAVYKWARLGIGGHKLRLVTMGCRTYVLVEDLNQWLSLTARRDDAPVQPTARSAPQVERAQRVADENCEAAGW